MKKSLSLLTISGTWLILVTTMGCHKTASAPPPSLSSQLVGTWTMVVAIGDYTDYGVNYKDTAYFTAADHFDFQADSTLSIVQGGASYNGRWEVQNARLLITGTNYMDSPEGYVLPVLDAHNLQIQENDTTTNMITNQNLVLSR